MIGLIITQISVILLFLILGWAVRFKKAYWLISGFASRSENEKEQLINSGYPQKTGSLLIGTAIGMLVLLPLSFTGFRFAMEVQFGFMMIVLLGDSSIYRDMKCRLKENEVILLLSLFL